MAVILRMCLIAACLFSRAAQARDIEALSPYLNEKTLLVAKVDFSKLDVAAYGDAVVAILMKEESLQKDAEYLSWMVKKQLQKPIEFQREFRKLGGREYYMFIELWPGAHGLNIFSVVPLAENTDGDALARYLKGQEIFNSFGMMKDPIVNGRVVECHSSALKSKTEPKDRPDIASDLGVLGESPMGIIYAPDLEMRKMLSRSEQPRIHAEFGGQETVSLLFDSMNSWIFKVADLNKFQTELIFKMETPDKAIAFEQAMKKIQAASAVNRELLKFSLLIQFDLRFLGDKFQTLKPAVHDSRVTVELDASITQAAIIEGVKNMAMSQKPDHCQLLSKAIRKWNSEKGDYPKSLKDLVGGEIEKENLLMPLGGGAQWVYRPPVGAPRENVRKVILHEPADPWPGSALICFADGDMRRIINQREFENYLKNGK